MKKNVKDTNNNLINQPRQQTPSSCFTIISVLQKYNQYIQKLTLTVQLNHANIIA